MARVVLLALTAASVVQAQSAFEGTLSMTLSGDNGRSTDVTYMVKDGKIRVEMPGGRGGMGVMIMDVAEKKMLILMAAQKMYMEQSMAGAMAAAQSASRPKATVTRTGRTESIAGQVCEHVTVTEEGGRSSDVCVAKGLGAFQMPSAGGRGGAPQAQGWEDAVGEGGFPLKVQQGDKVVMLVTAIEKKAMDAALFAPPADYEKMDMGAMMRKRP